MSKKVSGWPLIVPKGISTDITDEQVLDALAENLQDNDVGKVLTVMQLEGGDPMVMFARPVQELPDIEAGDAGKVLTVNAGETAAVWSDAPSGGGVTTVTVTYEYGVGLSKNLTFAQLKTAHDAGQIIRCYVSVPLMNLGIYLNLSNISDSAISFAGTTGISGSGNTGSVNHVEFLTYADTTVSDALSMWELSGWTFTEIVNT